MIAPVEISGGQVSAADTMSSATSSVVNWQPDVAGVNRIRPGLATYTTTGLTAALIGLYRFRQYVVGVDANRAIWALPDASPTIWTALSDSTSATKLDGSLRPVFAEDASDLFIVGGGAIQKWTGSGLTARLGAGPQATHIVNVAQRLIANDMTNPSRYYFSDLGDGADGTWGALSFASAEARPDVLTSIYENTAEVALFGATTTEVHGVTIDALNPFGRLNTINVGIAAAYSPIVFDNSYAWLDNRRRFVVSDIRSYEVISDAIAKDLRELGTVDDCWGYREETDRGGFLVWLFPTEERTFAYEYSTKKWHERRYWDGVFQTAWPVSAHVAWDALNINLVGAVGTAAVYELDTDTRTDLGGTIIAERITGWQDFGTGDMKRSARVRVTMRRGTATLGGTDGQLEVAVANDGRGWSDFKTLTTGQPSDLESTMDLYFGGVFIRRRYWLRYSGSDDMSLVSLHDDVVDVEAEE